MTEQNHPSILLVGCGNMGGALWNGWLKQGLGPSVVVDRHLSSVPKPHIICRNVRDIPPDFCPDIIISAIKPARMEETFQEIAPWVRHAIIVSVMAGRTVKDMRTALPAEAQDNPIVRAMPNTPSEIAKGVTGAFASNLSDTQKTICDTLLSAVGKVIWVRQEDDIARLTPISGSGPAYVFLFAELLEQVAVAQGFEPEVARALAQHTVSGAGALLEVSDTQSAALRRNVTSPNGVTAAALDVFMRDQGGLKQLMSEAVAAGLRRTKELASTM